MIFLECRPSSALGLERPGDATDALAPKSERVVEEAIDDTVSTNVATVELSVPLAAPSPALTEAKKTDAATMPVAGVEPESTRVILEDSIG
jgi:hypothetical protein